MKHWETLPLSRKFDEVTIFPFRSPVYVPAAVISRKRIQSGYTLIEMMVTVLLSSIMFFTVVVSAQTGLISMRTTDLTIHLNDQLRQAVGAFTREITQSSPAQIIAHFTITTDADGNSVVVFQVPVDADGDSDWGGSDRSDVVDNNTEYVQWGAHASLGSAVYDDALLDQWIRYSVQDGQLIRDVLLADQATVDPTVPPKVIANDISGFQVAQDQERLSVRLIGAREDNAQGGGTPRVLTQTYATQAVLRNDVF